MHSAVYAVVRCLSVRLSVCHTRVLCRNNRADHEAIIALDCSLGTLVYGHQTRNIISLGDLSSGRVGGVK